MLTFFFSESHARSQGGMIRADIHEENSEFEEYVPIDASKIKLKKPPPGSKIADLKSTIESQVGADKISYESIIEDC